MLGEVWNTIASKPVLQALALILIALACDAVWRWPRAYHPITLMRHLTEAMARRVRPRANEAAFQHRLSGTLGALVLLGPLVILVALLVNLAEYPVFFEALILLAILDFGHDRKAYKQVYAALRKEKKILARDRLQLLVARDTDRLSPVGIAKAAIEALLLRFYYIYCAVVFWFLLAGPIAALTYRLLLMISWQWHYRRAGFEHFVGPIQRLCQLLALLPAWLGALLLALVTHPVKAIRSARRSPSSDSTSLLLAMFGGALDFQLGGPAMYHQRKYRYPRVGGPREVRLGDVTRARHAIERASVLMAVLLLIAFILCWPRGW